MKSANLLTLECMEKGIERLNRHYSRPMSIYSDELEVIDTFTINFNSKRRSIKGGRDYVLVKFDINFHGSEMVKKPISTHHFSLYIGEDKVFFTKGSFDELKHSSSIKSTLIIKIRWAFGLKELSL